MVKKWVSLHQHTYFSNAISIPEVINKPEDYIDYAKENELPAVAFTEHGSVLSWTDKKMKINKAGMKYIHGVEAYVTNGFEEKLRDNYHLILLAKNHEGVKEINKLTSMSFSGRGNKDVEDSHFYYVPRLSFEEIKATSNNVLILTACLGGPLWKNYKSNELDKLQAWLDFFVENKHRVWLEVQPHLDPEQIAYNKLLIEWADKYDMNIVATNDIHAINPEDNRVRQILMRSKGVSFDDEDNEADLELWLKSYDEMMESFKIQGVLTSDQAEKALDETLAIEGLIEDFEFDYSFKYPSLFDNPTQRFTDLINKGYKNRRIDELPQGQQKQYRDRMVKEFKVYQEMKSIDYLLLVEYVVTSAREAGRYFGYARGSVSGSLIAFLLGVIEVDPIIENLSFERFMNKDRVSLSDVDLDISNIGNDSDRDWVVNFLINNDKFNSTGIVTYNTLGIKGAIKDMGRALGMSPFDTNNITHSLGDGDEITATIRDEYPELCELAEKVVGVVVSIGRHAGGFVVTTDDIVSEMGTVEVKTATYPIAAISMDEIESRFYVKLDILGLDNIGLVNMTCDLAGIDRATPMSDFIDFHDQDVMDDLTKSTIGIFQFEGQRAQKLVQTMFRPEVQDRMRENGVNADPVNQLAFLNAAMRPGAASIIDDVVNGVVKDNGHKALNHLLEDTLGYLIYQESQIEFLVEFCNRTPSGADSIRRAIGHKLPEVLKVEIPKIKDEFVETMVEKHDDTKEHAENIVEGFMQIFQDASDYSFSRNHSIPYSYIGYISAWLRYYYPLEFLTTAFEVFKDDLEKINRLTKYAKSRDINIEPAKFRYSKGQYFFNKETNTIYEGTAPIKGNNAQVGDDLYELRDEKFDSFTDFMIKLRDDTVVTVKDIENNSYEQMRMIQILNSEQDWVKGYDKELKALNKDNNFEVIINQDKISVDKTKLLSLIRLGYFDEFGGNSKLEKVFHKFDKEYKPGNKTFVNKAKKYKEILDFERGLPDDTLTIFDQAEYELFYLGRVVVRSDKVSPKYGFVTDIKKGSSRTSATIYNINKGISVPIKVGMRLYRNLKFDVGDLIEVVQVEAKSKNVKIDGEWRKHPTEKELWLHDGKRIRKSNGVDGK